MKWNVLRTVNVSSQGTLAIILNTIVLGWQCRTCAWFCISNVIWGAYSVFLWSFAAESFYEQVVTTEFRAEHANKLLIRGQSRYEFHDVPRKWHEARNHCRKLNGRLVSITDAPLQMWLSHVASQLAIIENGVWLGLHGSVEADVFVWDNYDAISREYFFLSLAGKSSILCHGVYCNCERPCM